MADSTRCYAVLHHEGIEAPHFDILIEFAPGSALMTWRCDTWPITSAAPVIRLPNHRRDYLEYEGLLSGNRGTVRRVAAGTVALCGYPARRLTARFTSGPTDGTLHLWQSGPAADQWQVSLMPDASPCESAGSLLDR